MKLIIKMKLRIDFECDGKEKVFYTDQDDYANEMIGVALNPKKYATGDIGAEVTLEDMGNIIVAIPTNEEKITLLRKMFNGEIIDDKVLIPYGRWAPNDLVLQFWNDKETVPVKFGFEERQIFIDKVRRDIYDLVKQDKYVPMMKVKEFGSLMYPVYFRRVRDEEEWILNSLKEVVESIYLEGLHGHVEQEKMKRGDEIDREMAAMFSAYTDFFYIEFLKIEYIKMYVSNLQKFYNIVREAIAELLWREDLVPERYADSIGEYKARYWKYLKNLKKEADEWVLKQTKGEVSV